MSSDPGAARAAVYRYDALLQDEYLTDFLLTLKDQEDRWSKRFYRRSPQLQFRNGLVNWLVVTCKELGLHPSTIHLAVKILDSFMDGHNIEQEKLTLVAIAALTIAAKFAEKETKVPRFAQLIRHTPVEIKKDLLGHTVGEQGCLETLILSYFEWNVFIPTAHSFVELLMPNGINPLEDSVSLDGKSPPELMPPDFIEKNLKSRFLYFVKVFQDIALQDVNMVEVRPSVLAASIIYASRRVVGLFPIWPQRLSNQTNLIQTQVSHFIDCAQVLLDTYHVVVRGILSIDGLNFKGVLGRSTNRPEDNKAGSNTTRATPCKPKRKRVKKESTEKAASLSLGQGPKEEDLPHSPKGARKKVAGGRKRKNPSPVRPPPVRVSIRQAKKRSLLRAASPKPDQDSSMASNPCEVATANEDEGYGSFLTASSSTTNTSGMAGENSAAGASRMSNVDLLIRSSDYLEATELRHAEFKRQIKREMLSSTLNEDSELPSASEIDEGEDDMRASQRQ